MKRSAGLLLWRGGQEVPPGLEVLLGHPGGPLFTRRQDGVWSIPKGEYSPVEEPLAAAYREFEEEIGMPAPAGEPTPLGEVRQRSGKIISVWAQQGELEVSVIRSNLFAMVWPPGSGRVQQFPELDSAAWCDLPTARRLLSPSQLPFLDRLEASVS